VVAATLAILTAAEIAIRALETRLSGNIAHMRAIPEIAKELDAADGARVLILGNSLINNAVREQRFAGLIDGAGLGPTEVREVTPDATSLWDWHFIVRNSFVEPSRVPDAIVVGFAWAQLEDRFPPRPSRLAGFFCDLDDLGELYGMGMRDFGDVSEFVVGKASELYVDREAIRNRTLDAAIPAYRRFSQELNEAGEARSSGAGGMATPARYTRLRRFLDMATEAGARVFVVAMPVTRPYDVDPELARTVESAGHRMLDFRDLPGIRPDMFIDPIHLGDEGAEVFMARLAPEIAGAADPREER